MKNYYEILGVAPNASRKDLKARFLALARERHPDRFQGEERARAELAFQDITEAFNILSDATRRREHDQALARPAQRGQDPQQLSKVYINRGVRAYKAGNFIEAADNFNRAAEAAPRNAQAWHHLALTCVEEQRWLPKAQQAIERACELAPEKASYFKLAGKIFAKSGMAARAKEYYNRAQQLGGPDSTVRRALQELDGTSKKTVPADDRPSGLFRKIW